MRKRVTLLKKLKKRYSNYFFTIPELWIEKHLKLKEGDLIEITLSKPTDVHIPNYLLEAFKENFKQLKKFSDKRITKFFNLFRIEKAIRRDKQKMNIFEKELEEKFGERFLKEYKYFKKVIYGDLTKFDEKKLRKLLAIGNKIKDKEFQEEWQVTKEILEHFHMPNKKK
jgi:hypothetical protein